MYIDYLSLKGTFYSSFFTFFSLIQWQTRPRSRISKFSLLNFKFSYIIGFSWILCFHRKRTVSLHNFGETLSFPLRIHRKCAILLHLWIHCKLLKAHSFTPHFRPHRLVYLNAVAENAKFNSAFYRRCSKVFGDSAKLCYALWTKTVSYWKFWISGRIWKRFSKMLAILCFVSIDDWKMQKKLKTDNENLVHLYR